MQWKQTHHFPLREHFMLRSGWFSSFLGRHNHAWAPGRGWVGRRATEDGRGCGACFTEAALFQRLLLPHDHYSHLGATTHRAVRGEPWPHRGRVGTGSLLLGSTRRTKQNILVPQLSRLTGSQMVSTQTFPKVILHLSAEAVDRKISVRQENIWKLRPIGGEDFFFFLNKESFSPFPRGFFPEAPASGAPQEASWSPARMFSWLGLDVPGLQPLCHSRKGRYSWNKDAFHSCSLKFSVLDDQELAGRAGRLKPGGRVLTVPFCVVLSNA